MMFASDDLQYIESEMINVIHDKAAAAWSLSELFDMDSADMTDTLAEYSELKSESQWMDVLKELEYLWTIDTEEHFDEG